MSLEIFHTNKYKLIVQEYLSSSIKYLFDNGVEFAIGVETRHIVFDPPLPSYIYDEFSEVVLLSLRGYSFETANISEDHLSFEAGFGDENYGSVLSFPILAIKQIFVDNYPIAINITEPIRPKINHTIKNNSMDALLKNPENKKFLKKAKK